MWWEYDVVREPSCGPINDHTNSLPDTHMSKTSHIIQQHLAQHSTALRSRAFFPTPVYRAQKTVSRGNDKPWHSSLTLRMWLKITREAHIVTGVQDFGIGVREEGVWSGGLEGFASKRLDGEASRDSAGQFVVFATSLRLVFCLRVLAFGSACCFALLTTNFSSPACLAILRSPVASQSPP